MFGLFKRKNEYVSIGWVNVYHDRNTTRINKTRMSSITYPTKEDAEESRSQTPVSTYVGTQELFVKVKP